MVNRIDINSKTEFLNRATMMDFVELFERQRLFLSQKITIEAEKKEREQGERRQHQGRW